jgi:hypothetical protein
MTHRLLKHLQLLASAQAIVDMVFPLIADKLHPLAPFHVCFQTLVR